MNTLRGKAWQVGDNVDTDQIIAGRYLSLTDPEELGRHCFEGAYPELAQDFGQGDIIVAGENFGCGSSREHAVVALKAMGVSCIVADSFARIFFRNCINLGLLPLECPSAVEGIEAGDEVCVDPVAGKIENISKGVVFDFKPLPPFLQEIIAAGDLTAYVRRQLSGGQGICSKEIAKMPQQRSIRCVLMRGGTSRGLYVMRDELPKDPALRDRVILAMYGSPDIRQIDGIGGADALTSKLAIIGPPTREDADIDYTFGQVSITAPYVDYGGNCGNISAGVGPFAIDEGLVDDVEPSTTVRIHQTNTHCIIVAQVPVSDGEAVVAGDYRIDGVPGTGAKIGLDFSDTAGAVTGQILPTGNVRDTLDVEGVGEVEVSIIDAGNPVVFLHASRFGLQGTESPADIDADTQLLDSIERVRGHAAQLVGMVEDWRDAAASSPYVPFIALVGPSQEYVSFGSGEAVSSSQVDFVSRLLFMLRMHKAYPITGTVCTGAAAMIPGTIVQEVADLSPEPHVVRIGHPSGVIDVEAEVEVGSSGPVLRRAAVGRTARRIMEGHIFVPEHIFVE